MCVLMTAYCVISRNKIQKDDSKKAKLFPSFHCVALRDCCVSVIVTVQLSFNSVRVSFFNFRFSVIFSICNYWLIYKLVSRNYWEKTFSVVLYVWLVNI